MGRSDQGVPELIAPFLPISRPTLEPLRADLDHDVETAYVVRPPGVNANVNVSRLKVTVVRLLRTLDCERDRFGQNVQEAPKVLLACFGCVRDGDDRHDDEP